MAVIKNKSSNAGVLIQLIGLVCLFMFFPLGLLLGIALILVGGKMARNYICSNCSNPITSKKVRICPACRATFNAEK